MPDFTCVPSHAWSPPPLGLVDGGCLRALVRSVQRHIRRADHAPGGIQVSVSVTGADPPTIYSIVVAGRTVSAAATAAAVVTGLTPGSYAVTVQVAQNCQVDGDNPRTVTVSAGQSTAVVFSVTCVAATGSLRVTTVTTGVDLDRSGYSVRVDGLPWTGSPTRTIGRSARTTRRPFPAFLSATGA